MESASSWMKKAVAVSSTVEFARLIAHIFTGRWRTHRAVAESGGPFQSSPTRPRSLWAGANTAFSPVVEDPLTTITDGIMPFTFLVAQAISRVGTVACEAIVGRRHNEAFDGFDP
jgi:hypothetical protein